MTDNASVGNKRFTEPAHLTKFSLVMPGDDFTYQGDAWTKLDWHCSRNPARASCVYLDPEQYVSDARSSSIFRSDPFAAALERTFGAEEEFGLYFVVTNQPDKKWTAKEYDKAIECGEISLEDEAVSFLRNGGSGTNCTEYARVILEALGASRVEIYGFANKDNPLAAIVKKGLHPGGHDFAVVDGRHIVDPWPRFLRNAFSRVVFDMKDDNDRHVAEALYGNKTCWKRMTEA